VKELAGAEILRRRCPHPLVRCTAEFRLDLPNDGGDLILDGENVTKLTIESFSLDMFGACLVLASFRIGVQQRSSLRSISHQEILDHPACPECMLEPFSVHNLFTKSIESLAEATK
jgi:hypothetical protein